MIIKFISYLLIYLISRKKNIKDNTLIILIAILQGFFIAFEYFYTFNSSNIVTLIEIISMIVIFYLVPFAILYLFKLADKITTLHLTVSEFEKEKQLKNSLFKITREVKNPIAVCKGYLDMLDINNKEQASNKEIKKKLEMLSNFIETLTSENIPLEAIFETTNTTIEKLKKQQEYVVAKKGTSKKLKK